MDFEIRRDENGVWHTRPAGTEGEGQTWGKRQPGIRRLARTYNAFIHLEEIRCPGRPALTAGGRQEGAQR